MVLDLVLQYGPSFVLHELVIGVLYSQSAFRISPGRLSEGGVGLTWTELGGVNDITGRAEGKGPRGREGVTAETGGLEMGIGDIRGARGGNAGGGEGATAEGAGRKGVGGGGGAIDGIGGAGGGK